MESASRNSAAESSCDAARRQRRLWFTPGGFVCACLLLSLPGIALVALGTRQGVGLSPDSATYIGAARTWASGGGLAVPFGGESPRPLTHYPPLYPLLLGVPAILGADPLATAAIINLLLLLVLSCAIGIAVRRYASSPLLGCVACLIASCSPIALQNYSMAWSEPLFIPLMILGCVALVEYLSEPRLSVLVASALALSLATLTRYAGLGIAVGGVLVLLLFDARKLRKRIAPAAIYLLIIIVPLAAWLVRNRLVSGTAAGRVLAFHPATRWDILSAGFHISHWLLPFSIEEELRWGAGVAMAAAFVAFCIWEMAQMRREAESARRPALFMKACSILLLAYIAFLLVARTFLDAAITFDNRILAPAFYLAFPITIIGLAGVARRSRKPATAIAIALIIVLAIPYAARGISWALRTGREGVQYSSREWKNSRTIRVVHEMAQARPGLRIFSNAPYAIYLLTGLNAEGLPEQFSPVSRLPNSRFPTEKEQLRRALEGTEAVVVYLVHPDIRQRPPTEHELVASLNLVLARRLADGAIYLGGGSRQAAP